MRMRRMRTGKMRRRRRIFRQLSVLLFRRLVMGCSTCNRKFEKRVYALVLRKSVGIESNLFVVFLAASIVPSVYRSMTQAGSGLERSASALDIPTRLVSCL